MLHFNYTIDEHEHDGYIELAILKKIIHLLYKNSWDIYKILNINKTKRN